MVDLERIKKECFWDTHISAEDLEKIIARQEKRELEKLFSKIIYNATDKLAALSIFSKEQLYEFFDEFKVTYNHKYINRHLLVLRALLLDEKVHIKNLEWEK